MLYFHLLTVEEDCSRGWTETPRGVPTSAAWLSGMGRRWTCTKWDKKNFELIPFHAINISSLWQDPVTDPGKTSKKGRLTLVKDSQGLMSTVRQKDVNGREDLMVTVFRCKSNLQKYLKEMTVITSVPGMEILWESGPGRRYAAGKTSPEKTTLKLTEISTSAFEIKPVCFFTDWRVFYTFFPGDQSYGPMWAKCKTCDFPLLLWFKPQGLQYKYRSKIFKIIYFSIYITVWFQSLWSRIIIQENRGCVMPS